MEDDIVTEWTAKRSGASLTIEGKQRGHPVKITGVEFITIDPEGPFASLEEGGTVRLEIQLFDDG